MSDKVRKREDGSVVMMCESGNPTLGVLATPTDKGLIVSLPGTDDIVTPFDTVNVLLGAEAVDALIRVAAEAEEKMGPRSELP